MTLCRNVSTLANIFQLNLYLQTKYYFQNYQHYLKKKQLVIDFGGKNTSFESLQAHLGVMEVKSLLLQS